MSPSGFRAAPWPSKTRSWWNIATAASRAGEKLVDRVECYWRQGYRRVKIKIQPGWDVEPVRRIREKYPTMPLMVDANASYQISDLPVFRELDRFGLMMYEQPLGRDALEEA